MTPAADNPGHGVDAVRRAAGSDAAFADLVAPHRLHLRTYCYQLLGSSSDADDAVQDTMFRAWRSLGTFEGRSSFRTWLTSIATNVCWRIIERRPPRQLPIDGPAAAIGEPPGRPQHDGYWLEPIPTQLITDPGATPEEAVLQRERVELALVATLQHLPAQQRAVFVLRELLRYRAAETGELLDLSVAAVNSALQRARATIDANRPAHSQQEMQARLGDHDVRQLVNSYTSAIQRHDLDDLLRLLTKDVTWSMPPDATWYHGRKAVARFLTDHPFQVSWRHRPTSANGQPAVICEIWDEQTQRFRCFSIDVLTLHGAHVCAVTAFRSSTVLQHFCAPEQAAEAGRPRR